MDVVVTGRHCTVGDPLREQVAERLDSIERLQNRAIRAEVEFTATETKGDPDHAIEAQITLRSKGPVIRAEGHAADKTAAFDHALDKLRAQLRKASDRRKNHRGLRYAGADPATPLPEDLVTPDVPEKRVVAGIEVTGDGPLVVREKEFDATPITLAQALDEMELVGHDFFLYQDAETGRPSVVYRRKAYDYGVIHLSVN